MVNSESKPYRELPDCNGAHPVTFSVDAPTIKSSSCNGAHPVTFSIEVPRKVGFAEFTLFHFDKLLSRINNLFPQDILSGLRSTSWQSARVGEIRQRLVLK
jgi:hypothetical protein